MPFNAIVPTPSDRPLGGSFWPKITILTKRRVPPSCEKCPLLVLTLLTPFGSQFCLKSDMFRPNVTFVKQLKIMIFINGSFFFFSFLTVFTFLKTTSCGINQCCRLNIMNSDTDFWWDFDWIQMVDKQLRFQYKRPREPHQLRKWSPKGQNDENGQNRVWEAPRSEFGYSVTGSTEMFTSSGPKWAQNGRKTLFWGCFDENGPWHTRPNQTSKTRKIDKIW